MTRGTYSYIIQTAAQICTLFCIAHRNSAHARADAHPRRAAIAVRLGRPPFQRAVALNRYNR
eukprot:6179010-Pleurochrysis_carterae.AAC.1